jgi:Na+/H+ antiporter NhaD/arsenite permease-like protein
MLAAAVGLGLPVAALPQEAGQVHATIGELLPLWSILPFAGILLSIALFPLMAPHFWHRHYPKVSLFWAVIFAAPFLLAYRMSAWHEVLHIYLVDYIPFIILLWGLFAVSGGLVLRGTMAGTPKVNTAFLLVGTLIASWTGTTGAAMLLIRPLLRANAARHHKVHVVVFFIFLVANIGGSLTPLGDPPLFLGFLHGVPFFWTLRLLPMMGVASVVLLAAFYAMDSHYFRKEPKGVLAKEEESEAPLRLDGWHNLFFLAGILGAVLLSGLWHAGSVDLLGVRLELQDLVRDAIIVAMALLSVWTTPQSLRADNGFTWEPMREVAILFAGIFATIIPALAILRAGESGHMAFLVASVREPWEYFWASGGLSSFLDNAPTYLTFFNMQIGRFYPGLPESQAVAQLIHTHARFLEAVAAGAVFMGANTYIGNAPNFMVRAIAEEAGVDMPSFFGYLFKWAIPILFPLFVLISLIFFS